MHFSSVIDLSIAFILFVTVMAHFTILVYGDSLQCWIDIPAKNIRLIVVLRVSLLKRWDLSNNHSLHNI